MVDVDHLRKIYSNYSTEELIKYFLVKPDDFVPEALSVIREEYQKREGDINILIKRETLKSGVNEFVIDKVQYFASKKGEVIGNLYLTSKGIYFIPTKFRAEILPYGAFVYELGLLGIIFDELTRKLSEQKANTTAKGRNLPLSLLTRYIEYSYGKDIENIRSMTHWKSGAICIVVADGTVTGFSFNKSNIPLIETWIFSHKIPATLGKGFFESILGKLRICKKNEK